MTVCLSHELLDDRVFILWVCAMKAPACVPGACVPRTYDMYAKEGYAEDTKGKNRLCGRRASVAWYSASNVLTPCRTGTLVYSMVNESCLGTRWNLSKQSPGFRAEAKVRPETRFPLFTGLDWLVSHPASSRENTVHFASLRIYKFEMQETKVWKCL